MAKKFERLSIKLSKENEEIFREMHQFIHKDISFEAFVNGWITDKLSIYKILGD